MLFSAVQIKRTARKYKLSGFLIALLTKNAMDCWRTRA